LILEKILKAIYGARHCRFFYVAAALGFFQQGKPQRASIEVKGFSKLNFLENQNMGINLNYSISKNRVETSSCLRKSLSS
jgi:hypothetical protein